MKNDNAQIIERYGNPSEFDYAPHLSICLNAGDGSAWVQMARDDKPPHWECFGCLEDALEFLKNKKNI